jgi:hypothetical protein
MPSGGARARGGPPPDPNALRRERDNSTWTTLPIRREGPTPLWPLTRPTKREAGIWDRMWSLPQSVKWEEMQQQDEVAIYVRQFVRCEGKDASAADRTLLLRMMEGLGLSQPGLARNHWRIESDQPSAPRQQAAATGPSVRDRFRVMDGTG